MILKQALVFAGIGVTAGMALSLWAGRFIASLLFGLTPRDPGTLGLTPAMLVAVAALAGYLPARRSALADSAGALKQD